jgi:hypothetical protein
MAATAHIDRPRPTALDALHAARRTLLRGERVEMQALASELGISRVTLHRWVGNRDLLLGEVLWSLAEPALREATASTRATGAAGIAEVAGRYLQGAHEAPWLRAFLEREGEIALRVLTTDRSVMQRNTVNATRALLETEVAAGRLDPPMDLADLAYIIVRIGESFLYTDVITGGEPAPEKARQAILALLT